MQMLLGLVLAAAVALAADPVTEGKYTGKWEGASGAAGDFVLSLAKRGDAWKAEVWFTMGTEKVNCSVTSLRVEGATVHVVYTFDLLGTKLESTIDGERSGTRLTGKYTTRSVADNNGVDQGTWEASATP